MEWDEGEKEHDDDDEEEEQGGGGGRRECGGDRSGDVPPKGQRAAAMLGVGKARRRGKALHRRVRSLGDLEYLDLADVWT